MNDLEIGGYEYGNYKVYYINDIFYNLIAAKDRIWETNAIFSLMGNQSHFGNLFIKTN